MVTRMQIREPAHHQPQVRARIEGDSAFVRIAQERHHHRRQSPAKDARPSLRSHRDARHRVRLGVQSSKHQYQAAVRVNRCVVERRRWRVRRSLCGSRLATGETVRNRQLRENAEKTFLRLGRMKQPSGVQPSDERGVRSVSSWCLAHARPFVKVCSNLFAESGRVRLHGVLSLRRRHGLAICFCDQRPGGNRPCSSSRRGGRLFQRLLARNGASLIYELPNRFGNSLTSSKLGEKIEH
mmetsp:Transcript_25110/g.82322  ORF Transcript_25110/g.82322 Transcript_25110/m.82322 type:complete len:239 (-) Transcript_25110:1519-2235(-)